MGLKPESTVAGYGIFFYIQTGVQSGLHAQTGSGQARHRPSKPSLYRRLRCHWLRPCPRRPTDRATRPTHAQPRSSDIDLRALYIHRRSAAGARFPRRMQWTTPAADRCHVGLRTSNDDGPHCRRASRFTSRTIQCCPLCPRKVSPLMQPNGAIVKKRGARAGGCSLV